MKHALQPIQGIQVSAPHTNQVQMFVIIILYCELLARPRNLMSFFLARKCWMNYRKTRLKMSISSHKNKESHIGYSNPIENITFTNGFLEISWQTVMARLHALLPFNCVLFLATHHQIRRLFLNKQNPNYWMHKQPARMSKHFIVDKTPLAFRRMKRNWKKKNETTNLFKKGSEIKGRKKNHVKSEHQDWRLARLTLAEELAPTELFS